jgi:hypothetical protein
VQDEVGDLKTAAEEIVNDLDCAEGCESHEDLIANLEAALANVEALRVQIRSALTEAKEEGPDA